MPAHDCPFGIALLTFGRISYANLFLPSAHSSWPFCRGSFVYLPSLICHSPLTRAPVQLRICPNSLAKWPFCACAATITYLALRVCSLITAFAGLPICLVAPWPSAIYRRPLAAPQYSFVTAYAPVPSRRRQYDGLPWPICHVAPAHLRLLISQCLFGILRPPICFSPSTIVHVSFAIVQLPICVFGFGFAHLPSAIRNCSCALAYLPSPIFQITLASLPSTTLPAWLEGDVDFFLNEQWGMGTCECYLIYVCYTFYQFCIFYLFTLIILYTLFIA